MTIQAVKDRKNRPRVILTDAINTAEISMGNSIRGFALVVWGDNADDPYVKFEKGTLPLDFLPEYVSDALSEYIFEDTDESGECEEDEK